MPEMTLYELGKEAYETSLRAIAYTEILNLFSAFTFFMRGNCEREALKTLWSGRDDIIYVADGRGYEGRDSVEAYMVTRREDSRREKLAMMTALFPDAIKETPAYLGVGDYEFHWLTTPNVRIADDLLTAKGAWWSPGINAEVGEDGEIHAYLHTINYGCDFICESGLWKIWHLREFEEFSYPVDGSVINMADKPGGGERELKKRMDAGAPKPNMTRKTMEPATKFRIAGTLPDIVGPYETWDDSMSCIRDY